MFNPHYVLIVEWEIKFHSVGEIFKKITLRSFNNV